MKSARLLVLACVLTAIGWWLFADTVRRYGLGGADQSLRISFWGDYRPYLMWREMLDTFRATYPDIPLKAEYITDRYESKIQQLLVAGSAPDVIVFQDESFPNYVEAGQFEDLTPFLDTPGYEIALEGFFDTAVQTFGRYEGEGEDRTWHMYGIPTEGGCNILFYNRDRFRDTGIRIAELPGPEGLVRDHDTGGWILDDNRWSMDEFIEVCRMLTVDHDNDGRIDRFGFSLPDGSGWYAFHWSMGARFLDPSLQYLACMGPEFRQFFKSVPREMEEAARIDGASNWQVYWHIFLPNAKAVLATVAILGFISQWKDFMGPLIYLSSFEKFPISLGLRMYQTLEGAYINYLMAASIVASLPLVVLFFVAQRYFVRGLLLTGSKG